jgi:hypothetical protein
MMAGVPYLLSGLAPFWQQQQQQQQQQHQQPPLNLNPEAYRCSKCLAQRQPHRQSKGEVVCIPRLGITPSDSSMPVHVSVALRPCRSFATAAAAAATARERLRQQQQQQQQQRGSVCR